MPEYKASSPPGIFRLSWELAEVSGLTFHDRDVIVPVEPTYGLVNRLAPFVGFQMLEEDFVQPVPIGDQHFISAREEPFQRTERHPHKRI